MPSDAVEIALASLSSSTLRQYNSSLREWWDFCLSNGINIYKASIPEVLKFFCKIFKKGVSQGTLNSYRSAISLILGSDVGQDERVKRLLKGAHAIKPNTPKYDRTWDPSIVLENFKENQPIDLKSLSQKLVTLLALETGHRVQTLCAID